MIPLPTRRTSGGPYPRAVRWVAALLSLLAASPHPGTAQRGELLAEVGGSRVLPPLGVDGAATRFLVAGLRAQRLGLDGSGAFGGILLGRPVGAATGGDFVSGEVGASSWWRRSPRWSLGLEGRALAFGVAEPTSYRAATAEGTASLRLGGRWLSGRLAATLGAGRSWVEATRTTTWHHMPASPTTTTLVDDLWRYGTSLEVLGRRGPVSVGVAAGAHRSAGGTYRSAGARLLAVGEGRALEARLDVWRTPIDTRVTGGVAFVLPLGKAWTVRGGLGRSEPDPLTLAEPGGGNGGVLLGRRLAGDPLTSPRRAYLHRVVESDSRGTRVRFAVDPPQDARHVALVGDFSLWEALAMTSDGDQWTVEAVLTEGTYHFGFLVDGVWYLPDDAPDSVADEWGRRSATLVIEGG